MFASLLLVPLFAVVILNFPLRRLMKAVAPWVGLLVIFIQLYALYSPFGYPQISAIKSLAAMLEFNFGIDGLSRILLFTIGIVLSVAVLVQRYLAADNERNFNFVNLVLLLLIGMNGMVMVRDLFSLYVFLEITSVSSFILIAFNDDRNAFKAVFQYLMMSVAASVLLLSSLALLFMITGDTGFSALGLAFRSSPHHLLITLALCLFLCAAFIKAGLMPFHGWVPDIYTAAPASVSVLLAGIVTKVAGVYTLIRIVTAVFGLTLPVKYVLLTVGSISIVLAAFAALEQNDFKRMLAYSSISQVGYILVGLGCGTLLGLAGAIFHLFNHAIFKTLLFVNSAAVESKTNTRNMNGFSGLAQKMPWTGITSVIASLSASGIPPLAGFWSKLIIIIALWMAGFHVFAVIAVLASVLTLAYFLSLQRRVFFGELSAQWQDIREVGLGLLLPELVCAVITVEAGVYISYVLPVFVSAARALMGG